MMGSYKDVMTLEELLEELAGQRKLEARPSAGQLRDRYGRPLAESPDGRARAYPNGYAEYCTEDGETVVWIQDCGTYTYRKGRKGPEEGIPMLGFPWYVAVALAGEDAIGRNLMNRMGDREGRRSTLKGDNDERAEEETDPAACAAKVESPECYVMRKEQIKLMLGMLSPGQRDTLVLVEYYGFSEAEIARMRTSIRIEKGDPRPYSRACVSKQLNEAKFRLGYRKVPF